MPETLNIIDVEIIRGSGIIVTFSDHTVAIYSPEELAALRPHREVVKTEFSDLG
jgi:hypothetical protein